MKNEELAGVGHSSVITADMKEKLKQILPYIGIPVIMAALPVINAGKADVFTLLQKELIIIFGYIAAIKDLKTMRIQNGFVLLMAAAWVIAMAPMLFLNTDAAISLLKDSAFGAMIGGGLFLFTYLISRRGLGGGDVKLMACTGLYLGFTGTVTVMLLGTVLAALTGLVLILLKKIGRKDKIPLAPFLYIGILMTVFLQ